MKMVNKNIENIGGWALLMPLSTHQKLNAESINLGSALLFNIGSGQPKTTMCDCIGTKTTLGGLPVEQVYVTTTASPSQQIVPATSIHDRRPDIDGYGCTKTNRGYYTYFTS